MDIDQHFQLDLISIVGCWIVWLVHRNFERATIVNFLPFFHLWCQFFKTNKKKNYWKCSLSSYISNDHLIFVFPYVFFVLFFSHLNKLWLFDCFFFCFSLFLSVFFLHLCELFELISTKCLNCFHGNVSLDTITAFIISHV